MEPEAPELLDALLEPPDGLFPGSVFPDPPFPGGSEPAVEGWRLPEDGVREQNRGAAAADGEPRCRLRPGWPPRLPGWPQLPGCQPGAPPARRAPRRHPLRGGLRPQHPAARQRRLHPAGRLAVPRAAPRFLHRQRAACRVPARSAARNAAGPQPHAASDGGGEAAAGAGGGDAAQHPAPHPGRGTDPEKGEEKDPEQAVGPGQPAEEEGIPGRAGEQGSRVLSPEPGAPEENPGAGEAQWVAAAAAAGAAQVNVQQGRPDQHLCPDPAPLPGTHPLPQLQPLPPRRGGQPGRRQAHRSDFQEHPDPGGAAGIGRRSPIPCAGVAAGGRGRICGCRGGRSRGGGREHPPRQGAGHQRLRPGPPAGSGGDSETGTRGRDVTGSGELLCGPGVGAAAGGHPARPRQGVLGVPPTHRQQLCVPVNKSAPGLHPNVCRRVPQGSNRGAEPVAQPCVAPVLPGTNASVAPVTVIRIY